MATKLAIATFQDADKRKKFESFAEDCGHFIFIDTKNKGDMAVCSCGWNGTPYWDGVLSAWSEWRKHVISHTLRNYLDSL